MPACPPFSVGVIVNPASGRDVRGLLGWASAYPTSEKVHVVLRLLAAMGSLGVAEAWMPPDAAGIAARVRERADLARATRGLPMPRVRLLDLRCHGTAEDSRAAAQQMHHQGVRLIAVLGGARTAPWPRAAPRCRWPPCPPAPTTPFRAGTRLRWWAWPARWWPAAEWPRRSACVPTSGCACRGRASTRSRWSTSACRARARSARALWRPDDLCDVYACFAEATAIGLSAIAAMAHPVSRDDPFGVHVRLGPGRRLHAPLMPGTVEAVSVTGVRRLLPGKPVRLAPQRGTVAIDGEREIETDADTRLQLELDWRGPRTLEVQAVLEHAARAGLMFEPPGPMNFSDDG